MSLVKELFDNTVDFYSKVCRCGHLAEDHHISYFTGGGVLIEECEAYGSNESGGLGPGGEEHCWLFVEDKK